MRSRFVVVRHCDNSLCRRQLPDDHVVMATTSHVRRFCGVACIVEGYYHHLDTIALAVGLRLSPEQKLVREHVRTRFHGDEEGAA